MGKLNRNCSKFILCSITGLIAGILIGAVILSIIVSYRMDTHYKKITYLQNTIQDKDARLVKLEKSINTQNVVLKDIEIILIFDGDEIDKIDIEKIIKEKYNTLLGKEVKEIDADILIQVVDKRILKMDDGEYKLLFDKLILTEILKIWIKIEPID